MSTFKINLVQEFKVYRTFVYEVEAKDAETAKAIVDAARETNAPAYDDPHWTSNQTLEDEYTYFDD